jgi:hypothetical protein
MLTHSFRPEGRTLETYKETAALVEKTGVPAGSVVGGSNSTSGSSDINSEIPSNSSGTAPSSGAGGTVPPSPSSPPSADANSGDPSAANTLQATGALSVLIVVALGFLTL